jgi:hypothetical protein
MSVSFIQYIQYYMSFPKMSIHYNPLNVGVDRPIVFLVSADLSNM